MKCPRCETDMTLRESQEVIPAPDILPVPVIMMLCNWCGLFALVGVVETLKRRR